MMFVLSGFADEIAPDLAVQLDVLEQLGIRYLELRGVWDKGVLTLSEGEVDTVKAELDRRGIGVSAIGSPIGKIRIDEPFAPHREDFRRAVALAERFGSPYIRVFSFFVPEGEAGRYRDEVMRRLEALLAEVQGRPVTLLHENERHIYGDIPSRCRDIHETLASPQLRMTFDPANFIMCGVRPFSEAWPLVSEFVDYVHVKDGTLADQRVVPAGAGDGEVRELLVALQQRGYNGFLSLEPHLALAGENGGFTGPELFTIATRALRGLLSEIGAA